MFGLFSPSRNFHLQAKDEADAKSWVELIKLEARIDEKEQEMLAKSPIGGGMRAGRGSNQEDGRIWEDEHLGSSSPEPLEVPFRWSTTRDGVSIPGLRRPSAYDQDYSGDDIGPYSDSDAAVPQNNSTPVLGPKSHRKQQSLSKSDPNLVQGNLTQPGRPGTAQTGSQSNVITTDQDDVRVIRHGYLLSLKSKGGVRQWKRHWVVLRPKNIAFYKTEDVSLDSSEHPCLTCSDNPIVGVRRASYHSALKHHQCSGD